MKTFRQILKTREDLGETNLYSSLRAIQEEGLNSWLTLLSHKNNSFNSLPHLRSVEKHIDQAVPFELKQRFNSKEIFLLLAAVLLHDIGKLNDKNDKNDNHAQLSCLTIQKNWSQLKIIDYSSAKKIAAIACSHSWDFSNRPPSSCQQRDECEILCECEKEETELNLSYDSEYGDLRLHWVAALLRIGDQVDNVAPRAIPAYLLSTEQKPHWRSLISSIQFDRDGQCIKLRTNDFGNDKKYWKERPENNDNDNNNYKFVLGELEAIEKILSGWERPLEEMGLYYKNAFIQTAIPRDQLYDKNGNNDISEKPLNKELLADVKKAAIRLSNGIIGQKYFSWEVLAAESGTRNSKLIQLAVQRIISQNQSGTSPIEFIYSNENWHNKKLDIENEKLLTENAFNGIPKIISTRIDYLDRMLCPENPEYKPEHKTVSDDRWPGGIYFPSEKNGKKNPKLMSPIIALQGSSGDGKTTLCTQIAANLIKEIHDHENSIGPWKVFYYTLEQNYSRVMLGIRNYGFLKNNQIENMVFNCEHPGWVEKSKGFINEKNGALFFPRLSPIMVEPKELLTKDTLDTFERRLSELKACLKWLFKNKKDKKHTRIFFIIDSLTAFSNTPLSRNQLFRLFSLFRDYCVPLLITLERQKTWAQEHAILSFNLARYLSDIEICLESGYENDYFRQTIEVSKTRYNRRILGKHQFKLKSPKALATVPIDDRKGVVIYPSIHYHLSEKHGIHESKYIVALETKGRLPIGKKTKNIQQKDHPPTGKKPETIRHYESNSCFVISGNHGCHKFALAMNLLLNHKPEQPKGKKLIVSFAEEKEIVLERVALIEEIKIWRDYLYEKTPVKKYQTQKIWIQEFGNKDKNNPKTHIKTIHFRMGQIMPEEVLLIIQKLIEQEKEQEKEGFSAVLINDTAHIRNLFPALANNSIFIPTLVDMIKRNEMYSVFIDIKRDDHIHKALMSAADCRFLLKNIKNSVSFQVHNVRGKDYNQTPYSVDVQSPNEEAPVLVIKDDKKHKDLHTDKDRVKIEGEFSFYRYHGEPQQIT